jgi:hypothetical protein
MSVDGSANPLMEIPLACNLDALDSESRSTHLANAGRLLSDVAQERRETADSLSFRFTAEDYPRIAEFIANERLCCPFFRFVLDVSPAQGEIWLHISGQEGAAAFLQAELSLT